MEDSAQPLLLPTWLSIGFVSMYSLFFSPLTVSLLAISDDDTALVVGDGFGPERRGKAGRRDSPRVDRRHLDPDDPVLLDRLPDQPILPPLVGREGFVGEDARVRHECLERFERASGGIAFVMLVRCRMCRGWCSRRGLRVYRECACVYVRGNVCCVCARERVLVVSNIGRALRLINGKTTVSPGIDTSGTLRRPSAPQTGGLAG